MSKISVCHKLTWVALIVGTILVALHTSSTTLRAQTTISTGSILGTVTDQSGAVVPGAKVAILNKATGQAINLTSTSTGTYNSGALLPGDYTVRVQAQGFQTFQVPLTVQVGVTANGNVTLTVGSTSTVVQVESNPVAVNTVQATVQGTVTTQQIEQLPINGRNFLDLAQLQPGVQIQDGSTFDPTKNGFSSISFGGRFGRTARIEVDGVDVSDETVGTTTINIPASGIQEFQVEQSSLDLSTELTSSGAVNVTTRSGTNNLHGEAFGYGRWHNTAARIAPTDLFFRREQFGTNVGGPIKRDKLFFFLDWERTRQDLAAPVQLSGPFAPLSTSINQPFKEHEAMGRLDWQIKPSVRAFYRFTYNIHSDVVPFIPNTFQPFLNRDHTQDHAAGIDFTTGTYTHSFRFGYLRFANQITDAVTGSGIFNPAPNIELAIGGDAFCLTAGADPFCSGINFLAPQATQQHDLQFKYDGSKISGSHVFRYGVMVNRILGGGFAKFLASAPAVGNNFGSADVAAAASGPFAGGSANPLNYPVDSVFFGNGQGFSTEIPHFGFPAGGQFDTRLSWYFGDDWKIRPNINLSLGIRYVRDTGRDDNDLPSVPILNQFAPGLNVNPRQPDSNYAPQIGIAWDPFRNGKTVIRAGAGLFYENAVFNNILFDRPARLPKGLFLNFLGVCPSSTGSITFPNGQTASVANICGQPIGSVANQIAALQNGYQAATVSAGPAVNGAYIGNTLADNNSTGTNLIAPDYRTPYSVQMNVGVQRELKPGTVLSVDFLRNVGLHYLLYYDTNHVGDARYLNMNAAMNAINATNQSFGCALGTAGIPCAIQAGATIRTYAANGLDSGAAINGGFPGCNCAFPGINPNVGQNFMLFPIGRSTYDGLDVSLRQNLQNPLPYVKHLALQVSYALSRFDSMVADQDFITGATDFDNINRYFGPDGLDRTHQFSTGGVADLPGGLRLSLIVHADSSLPENLTVTPGPQREATTAQIFQSDLTGDGTTGDILPGTNIGSFGRTVTASNVNTYISKYNNTFAGQVTPAGQALVSAGLFTAAQLKALGAAAPTLALAPQGQVGLGSLFTSDLGLTWVIHLNRLWSRAGETFTLQPSVTAFNITNSQNFDFANNIMSGILQAAAPSVPTGSANSTTYHQRTSHITLGSGVFALGAPRVFEWGMKVTW